MKHIKKFDNFVNEKWGDTHQSPTENIEPIGYNVGDIYYYVDEDYTDSDYKIKDNIKFKIDTIDKGVVHSISTDNKHQDNPSTLELNDYINDGVVKLIKK